MALNQTCVARALHVTSDPYPDPSVAPGAALAPESRGKIYKDDNIMLNIVIFILCNFFHGTRELEPGATLAWDLDKDQT